MTNKETALRIIPEEIVVRKVADDGVLLLTITTETEVFPNIEEAFDKKRRGKKWEISKGTVYACFGVAGIVGGLGMIVSVVATNPISPTVVMGAGAIAGGALFIEFSTRSFHKADLAKRQLDKVKSIMGKNASAG